MIKVFFCCSWDTNSVHFLKEKIEPLTPDSKGEWKNLVGVTNIKEADWVIVMDDIHNNQLKDILNFDRNKVICIPRESFRTNPSYLRYPFKHKYMYENFFHCWSSIICKKNYNELFDFKYPIKKKLCSTVTSGYNPNRGIYQERVNFIKKLSKQKQFLNKIDIFGYGWRKKELGEMYKGVFEGHVKRNNIKQEDVIPNSSKWDGLQNYSYSIAIENSCIENCFEEKFTDCILAWTIPIYYGCPNIGSYFPKDCYYWLDINSSNCFEELEKILNTPITEKQINALEKARELILNKYNVWDVVHNIIKNDKN